MARLTIFALCMPLLALPAPSWSHGGGLNAEGCHNNRATGDYHCHGGGSAGGSSSSRSSGRSRAVGLLGGSGDGSFANCSAARAAGPLRSEGAMRAMGRNWTGMAMELGASEPCLVGDVRTRVGYDAPRRLMEIGSMGDHMAGTDLLCRAIADRVCVTANYNGKAMTLAPHIVFTKHDDPFLGAVTVDQDGKKPKMNKLGTFKLAGLNDLTATTKAFEPRRSFRADDPQYAGCTLCALRAE